MAETFNWGDTSFTIINGDQSVTRITLKGRDLWALLNLIDAGPKGCTPIDTPAPRWSAYVFNLRQVGFHIETVTEPHGGAFSGTHGRYVLHSKVVPGHVGGQS
ncbi:hypothetical protein GCM10011360_06540 [Primorskyibacter flagellatus]|uniref:Winged helix domain-containing protein n=1 Tax=Primorskyibacter flagellatus TaxID=1387277 RepID=A0A917EB70_9RHOB|nr:hypothetical protein [Primorskyibacter flagellatus]GGE20567.1 hypothetical protein GCM10011360_06540 [Primorskyibacter flagellatus]